MILTGNEIIKEVRKGNITISPFKIELVNPNSYNYRLGDTLLEIIDCPIDSKKKQQARLIKITDQGFVLHPKKLYLSHTLEKIGSTSFVVNLIGRSSIARLGLFLQITADLGHTGESHSWTLELKVVQPLRVYQGMTIGQVSFWKISGTVSHYMGNYAKQNTAYLSKMYKDLNQHKKCKI